MSRGFTLHNPKKSKRLLVVYIKDEKGKRKKHMSLKPGEQALIVKSPVYIEDEPLITKLMMDSSGKLVKDTKVGLPAFPKRAKITPSEGKSAP